MADLVIKKIRGKQANEVRLESLRMLEWEKDFPVIEKILSVTNPKFFSSRTPEQVINEIKEKLEFDRMLQEYDEAH